jgi:hypothetical protein
MLRTPETPIKKLNKSKIQRYEEHGEHLKYSHVIQDDPKVTEIKIGLSMSVYVTKRYNIDIHISYP